LENSKDRFSFNACLDQPNLFVRMLVGRFCVLVGMLAMFMRRRSMRLRLVMLTHVVMMCGLQVMMGGSVMVRSSIVVMLA
jgi:hypothetical protein